MIPTGLPKLPYLVQGWMEWGYSKSLAVHALIDVHMCSQVSRGHGNKAKRRIERLDAEWRERQDEMMTELYGK